MPNHLEWRKKSKLHGQLWALGFEENEAERIIMIKHPLASTITLATWIMQQRHPKIDYLMNIVLDIASEAHPTAGGLADSPSAGGQADTPAPLEERDT